MQSYDIAIVGAGIMGLAHAYAFAKRGKKVVVFERSPKAMGASVRNFGMVWTVGQKFGEMRELATLSNRVWRDVLAESDIWHNPCGSLTLAYHEDELSVLQEFIQRAESYGGYELRLLTPDEIMRAYPYVKSEGLLGAMRSEQEICVDPRLTVGTLPGYLSDRFGVDFHFSTCVTQCSPGHLGNDAIRVEAEKIYVCAGDDFETLFPQTFADEGLSRSRLQMMRALPKNREFRLNTHLCAGLTLVHYNNFSVCDSLATVAERFEKEYPDHMAEKIHLLVSQHGTGEITIGDSHKLGRTVSPFNEEKIDQLILSYLESFFDVGSLEITHRWWGVYATYAKGPYFEREVLPGIIALTSAAGAGMTLSMGFGERAAIRALGENDPTSTTVATA